MTRRPFVCLGLLVAAAGAAAWWAGSPRPQADLLPGFTIEGLDGFEAPLREALAEAQRRTAAAQSARTSAGPEWEHLARLCQAHGLYDEACRAYEHAMVGLPDAARLPHLLGIARQLSSRPDAADGAFRRALELDPRDLVALCSLARILEDQGADDESRRLYLRAVEVDADCVAARIGLAHLAVRAGAVDMARKSLELALAAAPRCGPAHAALAALEARASRPREAELHRRFSQAAGTKIPLPDPLVDEISALGVTFAARLRRGELAAAAGDWQRAVEQFRAAASLRPGDAEARRHLGSSLLRAGSIDEGIASLREAARSASQAAAAWTQIARAHAARGALDPAREAVAQALHADAGNVEAHLVSARLAEQEGKTDEALAALERALAASPQSAPAHAAKARHYLSPGRDRERALKAHEAGERALELQADLAEAHEEAALASMQLREASPDPAEKHEHLLRALERLAQLVKYFPEHREGHLHWIRALRAAGRPQESEEARRKAHRLFPGEPRFAGG